MFVQVTLESHEPGYSGRFERAVLRHPEIEECHAICGSSDYMLILAACSPERYALIHSAILTRLPGVVKMQSIFTLRTVKMSASKAHETEHAAPAQAEVAKGRPSAGV